MPDLWISSAMVPRKGTEEYAIGRLSAEILSVGSTEVMVRSDQEPSIIALKEAAASRVRPDGVKVIPEESAVADSRGNGFAESTVKEVKNLARTLLSSLNAQYDHTIGGADAVVVWSILVGALRWADAQPLQTWARWQDCLREAEGTGLPEKGPALRGEDSPPTPGHHEQVSRASSG